MNQSQLQKILTDLISCWENEVVEFKQAGNDYSTDDIGKYFSALANEANLKCYEKAWLVFGVNNKTRTVTGTNYRTETDRLNGLKMQITRDSDPSVTFRDIHELHTPEGRVVLFEIPSAPRGIPIAWKGHYYSRSGESLTPLGLVKQDEIRQQSAAEDWSAQTIPEATVNHLQPEAIQLAKDSFIRKYANRFKPDEISQWTTHTFLDRARITIEGKITRTALLLLGKPESTYLLSPHPAQMTWRLEGPERAYEHFSPPFLLNTSELFKKIRNVQLRIFPDEALLPVEISKYDQKVISEALHNCIAHQDYTRNSRIIVIEYPDKLVFENEGSFFEGTPEDYVTGQKTPRRYRNTFLAQAMTELNMIDTMGYGIYEMHIGQARRYFPLPDYDLENPRSVKMTVYGKIIDQAFSSLLMQKTDLPIGDIHALDRIQKRLPVPEETVKRLRSQGLIEGRKPYLHISADIAKAASRETDYIHTRPQDDEFYNKLILDYLEKFKTATREDIDRLLWKKLSDALDEEQKKRKIANLLTNLRRTGKIINTGAKRLPKWQAVE